MTLRAYLIFVDLSMARYPEKLPEKQQTARMLQTAMFIIFQKSAYYPNSLSVATKFATRRPTVCNIIGRNTEKTMEIDLTTSIYFLKNKGTN